MLLRTSLAACVLLFTLHAATRAQLPAIKLSDDGARFVDASGKSFRVWGVNYDHDEEGKLIEDYWTSDWARVVEDMQEIKELGAMWCGFICKWPSS